MKTFAALTILIFCLACSHSKNAASKIPNNLAGTWVPVKQEMNGKEFPLAIFGNQKLILKDSTYEVIAESVDKGVVKYNGTKMDIYGKDGVNIGKHFTAIYKYENGLLTVCYNLAGTAFPENFDTKGHPLFFMSVFKKAE